MAGKEKSVENNIKTLLYFSAKLQECEHFIFYGTLLGLVRDGHPIPGDDDVDFYVNIKHRPKVVEILKGMGAKINYHVFPNNTQYFIQFSVDEIMQADFYFYDSEADANYIIDKWNFRTNANELRTPKIMIFPLKSISIGEVSVMLPSQPILICEYLYGPSWRTPLKKNSQYMMTVSQGKTVMLKKNEAGGMQLFDE